MIVPDIAGYDRTYKELIDRLPAVRGRYSENAELARVKTPALQKSGAKLRDNNVIQGQVGYAEARLRSARLYGFR